MWLYWFAAQQQTNRFRQQEVGLTLNFEQKLMSLARFLKSIGSDQKVAKNNEFQKNTHKYASFGG